MVDQQHIIEPERHGLWIAVTFVIALLALGISVVGIFRDYVVAAGTQTEVVILNQQIKNLQARVAKLDAAGKQDAAAVK